MTISGKTRVVALIGHPVAHSLSPGMHNAAFERMGLDYCYVAFDVPPALLRDAVAGVRALELEGLNVTVPHKEAVMPFLDTIDSEAAFIGAVNTVVKQGAKLVGHNTDGRGFMRSLGEKGIEPAGKKVLVVGAGGAARAISYYLCVEAASLALFDLDRPKAERLAADLKDVRGVEVPVPERLEESLPGADMVINATPLGLHPGEDPLPFSPREGQVVGDLIYVETPLQREAARLGCEVFNGRGMLLWQGVLASALWTGREPPHDVMLRALREGLR
ncbi:MAG: shikimate dehydrogenase [Nitrospirota bacterium]